MADGCLAWGLGRGIDARRGGSETESRMLLNAALTGFSGVSIASGQCILAGSAHGGRRSMLKEAAAL